MNSISMAFEMNKQPGGNDGAQLAIGGGSGGGSKEQDLYVPRSFLQGVSNNASTDTGIKEIGTIFINGALVGLSIWAVLMIGIFAFAGPDSYVKPGGTEALCHLVGGLILVVTNGSRLTPLILRDSGLDFFKNGFIVGTLAVQVVAIVSNFVMAFMPTPVVYDEVSGLHFHLVRWAEWIPLAFLMSFLTANIDAPFRENKKGNYIFPTMMALSTSAGLIFPFCTNPILWWFVMLCSWMLFLALYVMTFVRAVSYFGLVSEAKRNDSVHNSERLELAKASFILCTACCVTWTLLALIFTLLCVVTNIAEKGSWVKSPVIPVALTCIFEIASKVWYLSALVEAYDNVFDQNSRALRRLEELRDFMTAVWGASSDVIVFCVMNEDQVSARISPAFMQSLGIYPMKLGAAQDAGDVSLVLEIMLQENAVYVFAMDLAKPVTRSEASQFNDHVKARKYDLSDLEGKTIDELNVLRMAHLAIESCNTKPTIKKTNLVKKFMKRDGDKEKEVPCEIQLSMLEGRGTSCVLTFRDISDRLKRFDAEKKLVKESTTRQKDQEANNFTRHEVKNGILAAIGLLDHLKEILNFDDMSIGPAGDPNDEDGPFQSIAELDKTLRDIMDTILDEAMAREIIYGEYKPRKERMNVPEVLDSLRRRSSRRFPLEVSPRAFPLIAMDRQLLRYIYRNAVSNASKYGGRGGSVETRLQYEHQHQKLVMQVINSPGTGHQELLQLTEEEVNEVFAPDTQLEPTKLAHGSHAQSVRNTSSGNGAWIMQKCAESLGGKCTIEFGGTRTVFEFKCPVSTYGVVEQFETMEEKNFKIPKHTWGIAVDDSRIQRKVMKQFLKLIGIEKSKRLVLGASSEEIYGFSGQVKKLMLENPKDKFLLIVDENLDIVDGGTVHEIVSGSLEVKKMRSELDDKDERRLLSLVRSANDSDLDLLVYKSRAHGVVSKEPLNPQVLELIKPWWVSRFPNCLDGGNNSTRGGFHRYNTSKQGLMEGEGIDDSHSEEGDDKTVFALEEDIREALKAIQALAAVPTGARWHPIRDKLFTLKGDVKSTISKDQMGVIIDRIDGIMASPRMPSDFTEIWQVLQKEIERAMNITIDE